MLPSVTEPSPVPCLAEVSLRVEKEIKYVFVTKIIVAFLLLTYLSEFSSILKHFLSCSCVDAVFLCKTLYVFLCWPHSVRVNCFTSDHQTQSQRLFLDQRSSLSMNSFKV